MANNTLSIPIKQIVLSLVVVFTKLVVLGWLR